MDQTTIFRRIRLIQKEWDLLATRMEFDPARLRLNNDVLTEVVASFFRHLGEFKANQGIKWADRHKSGGFMMHWICRLKPVQLLVDSNAEGTDPPAEPEMLANELLAIQFGTSCLEADTDLVGDFDFFGSLVHRLRDRECPPEFLSSMLYLYERLRASQTPAA